LDRSAAHGCLDNVEQLLSSGQVSFSISLDITKDELATNVQAILKSAFVHALSSDVVESKVSIVTVSENAQVWSSLVRKCMILQSVGIMPCLGTFRNLFVCIYVMFFMLK
jgi:hypothetical protein